MTKPKHRTKRRGLIPAALASLVVVSTMLVGLLVPSTTAYAADGDLTVEATWLKTSSGMPVGAELSANVESRNDGTERLLTLQVGYSCGPGDACVDATLFIPPMQLDPVYGTQRFATLEGQTLNGATMTGNATTGYTIALGTIAPATAADITLLYTYQARGVGMSAQSAFPDGTVVSTIVTGSVAGGAPVSSTAAFTWRIDTPEAPRVSVGSTVPARADQPYTYNIYMSTSCQWERPTAGHGEPMLECASEHTTVHTLDPSATFISASHDGIYNAADRTVTWVSPQDWSQGFGWGPLGGNGSPRQVTVQYDSADYSGDVCYGDASLAVSVTATYASGVAKTADTTGTHPVNACPAFADVTATKLGSGDAGTETSPISYSDSTSGFWFVRLTNRSNVPSVAVVEDTFDDAGITVTRVASTGPAVRIEATLDNGATADVTATAYNAPAGRHITAVRVTSAPLESANIISSDRTNAIQTAVRFWYAVESEVPVGGYTRENTADVTWTFPGTPELDDIVQEAPRTLRVIPAPARLTVGLSAVVAGGGNPTPGQQVTYTGTATTSDITDDSTFTPNLTFLAPTGWNIISGSAELAGVADAVYSYDTVIIGGATRQSVTVTRPAGVVWGVNAALPNLTVKATPTSAVAANSQGVANFYMGDVNHNYTADTAIWRTGSYTDAADVNGDGNSTEVLAMANATVRVGAASALGVTKEICVLDEDDCVWVGSEAISAVEPGAQLRYRVTFTNNGTTPLNNIVAYDVLPHVGDMGTIAALGTSERGSTMDVRLTGAPTGTGVSATYSTSTNPPRSEVGVAGSGDWSASAAGARAIRFTLSSSLTAGQSRQVEFTAEMFGDYAGGDTICNSVAIAATGLPATESPSTCVRVEDADLSVTASTEAQVQNGRPATIPFTFENLGGSNPAQGTVTLTTSAGVSVESLDIDGWQCTATSPTAVECVPDAGVFVVGEPLVLEVPVIATGGYINAAVAGPLFDSRLSNNQARVTFDVLAAADLTVTKSDGVSSLIPGDEVTYTIAVANGLMAESLTDITVVDTLPAGLEFISASNGGTLTGSTVTWDIPMLGAGATETVTVTARVLETAANTLVNTVTASADDPHFAGAVFSGSASDTDQVNRLTFTKAASAFSANALAGDEVEYTFVVTNTGGGALTNVTVVDSLPGLSAIEYVWPDADGVLASGEQVTATATYALTQADIDAGLVHNSATVTANIGDGRSLDAADEADVPIARNGAVSIDKAVTGAQSVGEQVSYTFEVENTGNVTLTGVSIEDAMAGLSALAYVWPGADGVLRPSETMTATATYTLTQADIDRGTLSNTATVTGTSPMGSVDDSDGTELTFAQNPVLTLDKTGALVDPSSIDVGSAIAFEFLITNAGNVTVTDIELTDGLAGLSAIEYGVWPGTEGTLVPGQSVTATATYSATAANITTGSVTNTATVGGAAPGGTPSAQDTVTVPLTATPSISLEKTATLNTSVAPEVGDTVTFGFEVSNTGNIPVRDVVINDEMTGLPALSYTWPGTAGHLEVGESATATATYTLTQADIDRGYVRNSATAAAASNAGPGQASHTAQANLAAAPAIDFDKDVVYTGSAQVGDEVTFTFEARNSGNVTLESVEISDALPGLSAIEYTWPGADGVLAPGEMVTAEAAYTLTQADIDRGSVTNEASVAGTAVRGGGVNSEADTTVDLAGESRLSLSKTSARDGEAVPAAGDTITYTFVVENTGNLTVTGVTITDLMTGLSDVEYLSWPSAEGELAPGDQVTATATYALTQADIDRGSVENQASVTGTPTRGDAPTDEDSVLDELEADAKATFTKDAELRGEPRAGEAVVEYTFTITNTGNLTLTGLDIADELDGLSDIEFTAGGAPLVPGASATATASYFLMQDDIDAGQRDNVAVLTATPARGAAFEVEDDALVEVPRESGIEVVKTADADGTVKVGDTVTYTVTATNTGNVTLRDVEVIDTMPGLSALEHVWPGDERVLAPGDTVTATATYQVGSDDASAGVIENTATVSAHDPMNERVEGTDSVAVEVEPLPVTPNRGGLAFTGAEVVGPLGLGAALALVGFILLVARRRKMEDTEQVA